MNIYAMKPFGL